MNKEKNKTSREDWGCTLKNITVQRGEPGKGFCLKIPSLHLSVNNIDNNKLPLMGVSGAGKSTLLNLIAAMEWPAEGTISWSFPDGDTISWGNQGLTPAQAKRLRSHYFGYAFQASTLISHLTVWDNLCYPLHIEGNNGKEAREKAAEYLPKVLLPGEKEDLSGMLMKFPSQLSGGQRQRVALVQAMINDPCVLFADEPTGSLDTYTRKQVMEVVREWVKGEPGKRSLFWVTHHDSDPHESSVSLRLAIKEGRCRWQRYKGNYKKSWQGYKEEDWIDEENYENML